MHNDLLTAVTAIAPKQARKTEAWLKKNKQTPMPWIMSINQVFQELLEDGSIGALDGVRLDVGEARKAAFLILRKLGSRRELKGEAAAIGRDLRRYLHLLGYTQTHLLMVGSLESPDDTILLDVGVRYARAAACRQGLAGLLQDRFRQQQHPLSGEEQLGALVLGLILWDGVVNGPELRMALAEIAAGRIRQASDNTWHVYGPLQPHGGHQRRVLMSPLTSGLAVSLPETARARALGFDLTRSLKAISRRLPCESRPASLRKLLQDAEQLFRMQHHIRLLHVDFMCGHLVSDSLTERCYARLLGRTALTGEIEEPGATNSRARIKLPPPAEGDSSLSRIRRALSGKKRKKAKAAALTEIQGLRAKGKAESASTTLIIDWTEWLLNSRVSPSYILMLVGSVTRHMLPRLRSLESGLPDPDGWHALVEEISCSTSARDKVFDALANFAAYLEHRTGDEYETPPRSARAPVKALVISESELEAAIQLLSIRLTEQQASIAAQLMRMAFHLGCRRWELLGLQPKDVAGELEPCLLIRPNTLRDLKTVSSHRLVNLNLISDLPFYAPWRKGITALNDAAPKQSVFETTDFDVQTDGRTLLLAINQALQHVTGDPWASFHALRHSAANREFISLLIDEDDDGPRLPDVPFYQEARGRRDRIRDALLQTNLENRFEHEAISAALGHLSYVTTAGSYVHVHCVARQLLLQQMPDYPAEDDLVEMCLGGANMTRHTRAVRSEASMSLAKALEIARQQHTGRVVVYPPEADRPAVQVAKQGAGALADTLRGLSRRIGSYAQGSRPALPSLLAPTPEAAERLEAALPGRLTLLGQRLKKSGLQTDVENRNCTWREPADGPCRISVHHLCSRIESMVDTRDVTAMQHLAADLLALAGHLRGGRPGAYPFSTAQVAQERLRCMAKLLPGVAIDYELVIERSQKIGGKSRKLKSSAVVHEDICQIAHEGPGTLLVRPGPRNGRDEYRHRAWNWVTGMLVLAYGLPEE